MGETPTALIATLGGKPQVVTFAVDELLDQHIALHRVCAVHLAPSDPAIQRSLSLLRQAFDTHPPYQRYAERLGTRLRFDSFTIRERSSDVPDSMSGVASGRAIERIDDFAAPTAIWLTVHRLIAALKREGYAVILLVTGGPRLIGLQALSAASLLFDMHDQCLHLYTPPELRERAGRGDILHRSPDDPEVRLVQVPLLPINMIAPGLQQAALASPQDVLADGKNRLSQRDLQCARQVLGRLTPRQREVLREFARSGADSTTVAHRLNITQATLDSHKARIFEECRIAWGLPQNKRLSHRFLYEKFGGVLEAI
ncbi:MAG: CRISPR-associated ring nuclease [Thermoflexales bacterium]|nr:CRISPR-associated ring nuclease [Thermoflexales bacterium]